VTWQEGRLAVDAAGGPSAHAERETLSTLFMVSSERGLLHLPLQDLGWRRQDWISVTQGLAGHRCHLPLLDLG
jgi:hypothetical protein